MLEVIDCSKAVHKQGTELPPIGPKLVLECTETNAPETAVRIYDRDPRSHRPHYVIDPVGYQIFKTSDSTKAVIGTFDPSGPQFKSRCVFVAICKFSSVSLEPEHSVNVGRLLRVLCDIEGVPAIIHDGQPGSTIGPASLNAFEGILGWAVFPGTPEITQPGNMDWVNVDKGLQDYATPERLGISPDIDIYEDTTEAAEEVATEDLESQTVAGLREIASELGLSYRGLKKTELIDAITAARS
jgi:hypothetical protein